MPVCQRLHGYAALRLIRLTLQTPKYSVASDIACYFMRDYAKNKTGVVAPTEFR